MGSTHSRPTRQSRSTGQDESVLSAQNKPERSHSEHLPRRPSLVHIGQQTVSRPQTPAPASEQSFSLDAPSAAPIKLKLRPPVKEPDVINTWEKISAPAPATDNGWRSSSPDDYGEGSSTGEYYHGAPAGFRFSPERSKTRHSGMPLLPKAPANADVVERRPRVEFTLSPYSTPSDAEHTETFDLQPDPQLGLSVKLIDIDASASDSPGSHPSVFSNSPQFSPTQDLHHPILSPTPDSERPSLVVRLKLPKQVNSQALAERVPRGVEISSISEHTRRAQAQFQRMAAIRHFVFGEPANEEYLSHISSAQDEQIPTEPHRLRRSSSVTVIANKENIPTPTRRAHFIPPLSEACSDEVSGRNRDSVGGGIIDDTVKIEHTAGPIRLKRSSSY
jgi:hypothetical protein